MSELLTFGGFILSAIGVILAIAAMVQAASAKQAVDKVLKKSNDQVTRDDTRELLNRLNTALSAAMARRGKPTRAAVAGRAFAKDLEAIKFAQNAMATMNVSTDATLEGRLRLASGQLNEAIKEIEIQGKRDGWADALGVIQGVVPKVNTHQRQLGTKALQT